MRADELSVLGEDAAHLSRSGRADFVEQLHRLDEPDDLGVGEALEELGYERVGIGAYLSGIGHQAASRLMTSATLCPPNPIEFESDRSTFALRARFGT